MAKQKSDQAAKDRELKYLRAQVQDALEANRERQAAFKERRKERGEVRLTIWVPKNRAVELREIAHHMCDPTRKAKTPSVQIPVFEISENHPGWSYLKVGIDEKWIHLLLRANGGQWRNKTKVPAPNTWRIRSDLVAKLGLESRVVLTRNA